MEKPSQLTDDDKKYINKFVAEYVTRFVDENLQPLKVATSNKEVRLIYYKWGIYFPDNHEEQKVLYRLFEGDPINVLQMLGILDLEKLPTDAFAERAIREARGRDDTSR